MDENVMKIVQQLIESEKERNRLEVKICHLCNYLWNEQNKMAERIKKGWERGDEYYTNNDPHAQLEDHYVLISDVLKMLGKQNSVMAESIINEIKREEG